MKSTLFNMVAVLLGITLIASAGVGAINMVTKGPIEQTDKQTAEALVRMVLPEGAEISPADTVLNVKGNIVTVSTGTQNGEVVGYAVSSPSLTQDGFAGKVSLMVGFTPDGRIFNIQVLKQNETPGLGTNMKVEGNKLYTSFFDAKNDNKGRNPGQMNLAVKQDGGDVDALTAATISSRAYVNAVASAYAAYLKVSGGAAQPQAEIVPEEQAEVTLTEGPDAQKGAENE